jgi:3-deoxy-manno-octulosonate cytidylyltransferase (CMP-KDO synthetase)
MLKSYHIIPFRREFLFEYASWGESRLEKIEFNEYLRILEKGHKFLAVEVETGSISIDTPDDLAFVREAMKSDPLFPEYAPN